MANKVLPYRGKPSFKVQEQHKEFLRDGYVHGYLIGRDVIVGEVVDFNDEYFNTEYWFRVNPYTVGQFTGWFAENGPVYEGQVLRWTRHSLNMEWVMSADYVVERAMNHNMAARYVGTGSGYGHIVMLDEFFRLDNASDKIEIVGNYSKGLQKIKGSDELV